MDTYCYKGTFMDKTGLMWLLLVFTGIHGLWAMERVKRAGRQVKILQPVEYDRNNQAVQVLIQGMESSLQKWQTVENNIKNLQAEDIVQSKMFNVKKRIFCFYGIIGIELCTCCYFIPQSVRKNIPMLWGHFKRWASNYHAQSIPRNIDESLPVST